MVIAIDTREQMPYTFKNAIIKTLAAGDYSVVGLESLVTIERKSKIDAYGTIGKGRKRFIRELEKLAAYDYAAIVIESNLTDFLQQPRFSQLRPKSAINSLIAWTIRYKIHIFFACDRAYAAALTYRILEKYYHEHIKKTQPL